MASEKDITSTEKLLDVIRGGKAEAVPVEMAPPASTPEGKVGHIHRRGRQKGVSIGIDIGYTQLRFVKIVETADKGWRLLDYAHVPLDKSIERDTDEFADFLKAELTHYCGSKKGFKLWAIMSAASTEVQNISVPKVARKELRNVVFWSAKQEASFNEETALFDFEVQGDIVEKGIEKLSVLFYVTPKNEVDKMRALFESIGFPLDGLTIAPLALQNLFRTNWVPAFEKTVALLYVGRSWSRIDIFSKGNLVMTRGIKAGINSMVESLVEKYEEKRKQARQTASSMGAGNPEESNALPSFESTRVDTASQLTDGEPPDDAPMDLDQAGVLVTALSPDAVPATELSARFGLNKETIFDMINPALERLVRQVERTFEHYSVTMGRESVSAVYVSTAMDVYRPIVEYIGGQLAIAGDVLDPLDPDHRFVDGYGEECTVSERAAFAPVLGAALSDMSRTLNLIFTSEDKEKQQRYNWVNKAVVAALVILMIIGSGWYLHLSGLVREKQQSLAALEKKFSQGIKVDETIIAQMISEVKKEQESLKDMRARYLATAVLGEVARLTGDPVKLLSLKVDLDEGADKKNVAGRSLNMDGIVVGTMETLDSSLAAYVLKLQSSPFIEKALIKKKSQEKREGRNVLRFTMAAALN